MISEDEYSQESQPVEVEPEDDNEIKSRIHEDDERFIQNSQDQMISKNESENSRSVSEQSVIVNEKEREQQIPQKPESQKFMIRFPKTGRKKGSELTQNKQRLPLSAIYPWLSYKTLSIQNPLIKLHNQIIDFFLAFQQQEQTHNFLLSTFNRLQGILFKTFKNCEVLAPFLVNRVYLKNSEVEIFILFDQSCWKTPETIEKVRECLAKMNFEQIRFFEAQPQQGKQHKVGFNCMTVQKNYQIQVKLVTQEWISYLSMINDVLENSLQGKYLHLILDTMVRQRLLQNAVKGYFLFGIISVFIQERKRQKHRSLTQNLLKFLQYFGMGPFPDRRITYVGRGQFEITQDMTLHNTIPPFSFWISPTIDISNHTVKEFFALLKNRYRLIGNYNFANSESILWTLLNPNQGEFSY